MDSSDYQLKIIRAEGSKITGMKKLYIFSPYGVYTVLASEVI